MADSSQLKRVYEKIINSRRKYGYLKKCEFHIHTPASFDYCLIKDKKYKELSTIDILDLSEEKEYLNREIVEGIKNNLEKYTGEEYISSLKEEGKPYESLKEYLSYMNIAHKLYSDGIEVAVISDHNTIRGYPKLKYAVEEYYESIIKGKDSKRNCIYLFLGVEISCSDKNHLIVIHEGEQFNTLNNYLDEIILSEKDGTYLDSRRIIEDIDDMGGISYLAHINSSDLMGNKAYNMKLFESKGLKGIGITDIDQKESQVQRLQNYNSEIDNKIPFIIEGDSHELDTLGKKNTWIKFNKINFTSLKNSFVNFGVCIYLKKPNGSKKFIKGVVVQPGEEGFLKSQTKDNSEGNFSVEFSKDLNCIIGGRGTGKSTLLNIIQTIFSNEVQDQEILKFVSNNEIIYSVFHVEGKDYILRFIPQTKDIHKHYYVEDQYLSGAFEENKKVKYLANNWIEVFEVLDDDFKLLKSHDAKSTLEKIYSRSYNINDLVNKINNGKIGEYIREIVAHGIHYEEVHDYIKSMKKVSGRSFAKHLRENLQDMINFLEFRTERIDSEIYEFNNIYKDLIEVVYKPDQKNLDSYLFKILDRVKGKENIQDTYLTWDDAQNFIVKVIMKIGFLEFLNLLLNKKYKDIEKIHKISNFYDEQNLSYWQVEKGLKPITQANIKNVYKEIYDRIIKNRKALEDSIIQSFEVLNDFSIKFNINSKESVRDERVIMKDIRQLSLGQKVVALLTFIFIIYLTLI